MLPVLPQRRGFFTTELQKLPFPTGVQPGPQPQPLYLNLEAPVLSVVIPGDPLPPGTAAVKLDARITNPPGTIIRYTTDSSDPATVEFPLNTPNPANVPGVFFGGQPDWIAFPSGTTVRARTTLVEYYSNPPPPGGPELIAQRIIADSPITTFIVP